MREEVGSPERPAKRMAAFPFIHGGEGETARHVGNLESPEGRAFVEKGSVAIVIPTQELCGGPDSAPVMELGLNEGNVRADQSHQEAPLSKLELAELAKILLCVFLIPERADPFPTLSINSAKMFSAFAASHCFIRPS